MERDCEYLIGLDLGTSTIKGVLMSSKGAVLHREKSETGHLYEDGGVVEFNAEKLYHLAAGVIRRLAAALPEDAGIAGISMASASGNTLLLDSDGSPLANAISWMDTRVDREMEQVLGRLDQDGVHELAGWPLIKMFPLAHLSWLKCHEPALLDKAARICMTTDFINFRLTGEWGIDTSTAATFYLQDQKNAAWHRSFLDKLGIPERKLPPIGRPGSILGLVRPEAARETGLPEGTPVVLGSFDHPCAARGTGVLEEGQLLLSCGTSWVGFYPVSDRSRAIGQKMLVDTFLAPEGPWGAMFSLPAIATGVDRYLCRYISDAPDRHTEFDKLSAASEPGAGGLFIDPLGGEGELEPGRHTKQDIARALMEGTAYLLKYKVDQLEMAGMHASSAVMAGGPSETWPWPQITSDILGLELSVINGSCAGAAGAAILAGIGAGLYRDAREAFDGAAFKKTVLKPNQASQAIYKEKYKAFAASL